MPTLSDYVNPRFIPYQPNGWTLTRLTQDRYMRFDNSRSYRNVGRGYSLQAGYNAENPTTAVVQVQTNVDSIKMRPRIVDILA